MIPKIKICAKKFKKYDAKKQSLRKKLKEKYPANYVFYASYNKALNDTNTYRHSIKHTEAFLVDSKSKPKSAIRLTGDNNNDQVLNIIPDDFMNKYYDPWNASYIIQDGDIKYSLHLTNYNKVAREYEDHISLATIINRVDEKNQDSLNSAAYHEFDMNTTQF